MQFLLKFIIHRSTILLLGLFIFLSLVMMNFNDSFELRGLRVVLFKLVGEVNSVEKKLASLDNANEDNKRLRSRLLELSVANQQLQEVMIENIRLRRLLTLKRKSHFDLKAANVIGLGQEETIRSIIIDAGRADSISKNMAVINDQGLVGKIIRTEDHFSVIQILLDRSLLVSVRLQNSREVGTISWSGNVWLDLRYIPKDVKVEPGEIVMTSGLSEIYPPGIKIGIVGEVKENSYDLFKQIKVKPMVTFNNLEEVFIVLSADSLVREPFSIE